MRRRKEVPNPEAARELAALDAALAGEPVEPGFEAAAGEPVKADLAAVAELALAVRAERPAVDDDFAATLDAWAASGFAEDGAPSSHRPSLSRRALSPRGRLSRHRLLRGRSRSARADASSWLRARASRRFLLPALGAAASLLLVVAIAGSLVSGGQESGDSPLSIPGLAPAERAPGGSAGTPESSPPDGSAATPGPTLPATGAPGDTARPRRVERQASLVLTAGSGDVSDVADGVIRATDEVGGIVVRSSVSSGDQGRAGATFQLRVPTDRLDDALARLSKLGHVRSRTQNSQDVTGSFTSARERLDQAVAERKGLLRALARADSANQTESIRARLRIVQSEIASARSELRRLRVRTDFSAVSVSVEAEDTGSGGGAGSDGSWTPSDAVSDAVRVLEVIAGVLLVSLAVLIPLAALAALAALSARTLRRRSRERALSTS